MARVTVQAMILELAGAVIGGVVSGAISGWFAGRSSALKVSGGVGVQATGNGPAVSAQGDGAKAAGRDNVEVRPPRGSVLVEWEREPNRGVALVVVRNGGDGWANNVTLSWQISEPPEPTKFSALWDNMREGPIGNLSPGQSVVVGKRFPILPDWPTTLNVYWNDEDGKQRSASQLLEKPR